MRLSDLQRMRVIDPEGKRIGHVFDVLTITDAVDSPPRLEAFLVGRGGLARRLGIGRGKAVKVTLEEVERFEEDVIVASREVLE